MKISFLYLNLGQGYNNTDYENSVYHWKIKVSKSSDEDLP